MNDSNFLKFVGQYFVVIGISISAVAFSVSQAQVNACSYAASGRDMGDAINAAILANPRTVIDARCFAPLAGSRPQTWQHNIFANVNTSGELLIGAVSVIVAAQQDVPSGWRILGAGPGATNLRAIGEGKNLGAIFQIAMASNVQIESIEIDGNGLKETVIPIQVQSSVGVWIKNSYIHDGTSTNIGIDTNNPRTGSAQIHIESNRIGATHDCGTFDLQISPLTTDYSIKNNFIFGGQCYGIGADGSSFGTIIGNDISGGQSPQASGGIQIEATNGNVRNIIVADNIIHDFAPKGSTAYGIAVVIGHSDRALTDILVSNNVLSNFSGRGIVSGLASSEFVNGTCRNVTLTGNTVHDISLVGIRVMACKLVQIEGNNIYNVGTPGLNNDDQDGIVLANVTGFVVQANLVTDFSPNQSTRYGITLDEAKGNAESTDDGFLANNYVRGTRLSGINNIAKGVRIQVQSNHEQ